MKNAVRTIYKFSAVFSWLWFLIIFILCATPGQYIPSANWLELLSVDKLIHAGIFFILTTLFFLTAIKKKQSTGMISVWFGLSVLYGAALEWMQANLFTNRSADWQDIVANSFGCVLAFFVLKKLRTLHFQMTNKQ